MNIEKNQEYIVEIIDNGYEGEGIAKIDGFTIFIPGAIKGEKIRILQKTGRRERAELERKTPNYRGVKRSDSTRGITEQNISGFQKFARQMEKHGYGSASSSKRFTGNISPSRGELLQLYQNKQGVAGS